MKTAPDRLTLLDNTHKSILKSYDIYYQESEVRQSFPLHWHTFCEIELVVGGNGTQGINGHSMHLEPGSFYLLSPTDMHRLSADVPLMIYSIKIPSGRIPAILEKQLYLNTIPAIAHLHGEDFTVCRYDFLRLRSFLSKSSPYGESKVNALIVLLLTTLFDSVLPSQSFESSTAFHRIHAVLRYIQSHFLSPITLDEVACVADLSPNYLSAQFTQAVGCGFIDYLTQLRVQHACTLLEETDMRITEIAYDSGFGSLSHFIRCFHKQKHEKPSAYRSRFTKPKNKK